MLRPARSTHPSPKLVALSVRAALGAPRLLQQRPGVARSIARANPTVMTTRQAERMQQPSLPAKESLFYLQQCGRLASTGRGDDGYLIKGFDHATKCRCMERLNAPPMRHS